MGRPLRSAAGGWVYHVLNRANARATLFEKDGDYEAFEHVLAEAHHQHPVPILGYCVMPNHWHLIVRPHQDGDLSRFLGWLTLTHTQRWHAHHHTTGTGHLYQGRFKSFPIQADDHFLTVCRYVERNPLRAGLVNQAETWPWSSLARRHAGSPEQQALLSDWPVPRPRAWLSLVNQPETAAELEAIRRSIQRGQPFGDPSWVQQTVRQLGLETTLCPRGRPRKQPVPTGLPRQRA